MASAQATPETAPGTSRSSTRGAVPHACFRQRMRESASYRRARAGRRGRRPRRRPLPRRAAARRSVGVIGAHGSVAWRAIAGASLLLATDAGARLAPIASGDAWPSSRLLHKPLIYPVRYDEVQRVDFAGGQKSRKDLSIAARRPYTAPTDRSRDARLEILQRPHLCATASVRSGRERDARGDACIRGCAIP